jgi:hypothetical protein
MIRYSYNRQVTPPAPFFRVALGCAETGKELADVTAAPRRAGHGEGPGLSLKAGKRDAGEFLAPRPN